MSELKNILVTGSNGFIGKNFIADLEQQHKFNIFKVNRQTTETELNEYSKKADFVFHLAGVNRPKNESEFYEGNRDFTSTLLNILRENKSKATVVMSSSIQAENNNPYGDSKLEAEKLLIKHAELSNTKILIYRLPNVFGKWCKPNYNSVIATFCHKIARNEKIELNKNNPELNLVYIDDVVKEFNNALSGNSVGENDFYNVNQSYNVKLNEIVELIQKFKTSRTNLLVPDTDEEFSKKLYSTYLSYLPEDNFSYPLKMNVDERGSFTEFLKSNDRGQVSVNVSKPNIIKGNHWHHTKNEKFLVVSGKGVIRFRKYNEEEVLEYFVSEEKFEVIDIPVGYTHNIENIGNKDMVTIMWVNEIFNPNIPDTYYEEV